MNIYYHFYSGERISSLKSLKDIYDYVSDQDIAPVFASDYIKTVLGWKKTKVEQKSSRHFVITANDHLRTLRFDGFGKTRLYPNYQRSENVIGHRILNDSLYIHLGNKKETILHLTSKKPSSIYVSSCNGYIDELSSNKVYKGFGRVAPVINYVEEGKSNTLSSKKVGTFELKVKSP